MSKPKITILVACVTIVLSVIVGSLMLLAERNSPQSQLARARTLYDLDKLDALESVRSAIKASQGRFPDAQLLECQILIDLRRGREANEAIKRIDHLDRCDPESLCRLADNAILRGVPAISVRAYEAAGDFVKKDPQRMKNMIYALYSLHEQPREEDILKLCEEYSRHWPEDVYPWIMSAGLYNERNVPVRAASSLREALNREIPAGEATRMRMSLMQLSMQLGDLQTAREQADILEASTPDLNSVETLPVILAELLLQEGKPAEALEVVEKLPEHRAAAADVRALRGKCRSSLGDYTGAISELSLAVRLNDFDQSSHYLLGQAYLKIKNQELATLHLNRSQQLNDLTAQILKSENELRNDLDNRQLKLKLATLNEQRGNLEKANAWRRGAMNSQ